MPKQKTNRGAAKRFQLTKNGKIKRQKAYASHLLTHKSSKRKRRLRKADIAHPADQARIRRMLVA